MCYNVFMRRGMTVNWTAIVLLWALLCIVLLGGCAGVRRTQTDTPDNAVAWSALPGWTQDNHAEALMVFLRSCPKLQGTWQRVCAQAANLPHTNAAAKTFFEKHFIPYQLVADDGGDSGLITGYYEPLLNGSRTPTPPYQYPLYARPSDLLAVKLGDLYPELKNKRLRGRAVDGQLIPYYSRAEIDGSQKPLAGHEIFWVDDKTELFFLHIQGSGLVRLPNGEIIGVGYRDQNGHPYRSIGGILAKRGDMALPDINLFSLREWLVNNPQRADELLNQNPSYIFFVTRDAGELGPFGSLGVPLTPERSLAVDKSVIPLGAPVWLSTVMPNDNQTPLARLMTAQDTGGAIKGDIRADFFWGAR